MRSSAQQSSTLRAVARASLTPLVVVGVLAVFVLAFSVLAVAVQLVAELLKHAGI